MLFAGEAMSREYPSTVHGALLTGCGKLAAWASNEIPGLEVWRVDLVP